MALTLRLNIDEEKELNELMETYEIKTASGCIKMLINNFGQLRRRLREVNIDLMEKLAELERLGKEVDNLLFHEVQAEVTRKNLDYYRQMGEWPE
jgi:hypothetical protein